MDGNGYIHLKKLLVVKGEQMSFVLMVGIFKEKIVINFNDSEANDHLMTAKPNDSEANDHLMTAKLNANEVNDSEAN